MKERRHILRAELSNVSLNRFVLSVWEETVVCEKDAFTTQSAAYKFAANRYGLKPEDIQYIALNEES